MRIIDSHFHWWPRAVFEEALRAGRTGYPRIERNTNGGYDLCRNAGTTGRSRQNAEWFDLGEQLAHMATLGYEVDVICSIGPFSLYFSELPMEEGRAWRCAGTRKWQARRSAMQGACGPAPRCRCRTHRWRWRCWSTRWAWG